MSKTKTFANHNTYKYKAMSICNYTSPIGTLQIEADETGICRISLTSVYSADMPPDSVYSADMPPENDQNTMIHADSQPQSLLAQAYIQLREYFSGTRREFDLPLSLHGTEFQQRVWAELQKIPYGETRSYSDIAHAAGCPKGFRAVGMANNRNPVMIVVPCHRVIGKNGSLTGYAGGLKVKQALLQLEQGVSFHNQQKV